MNESVDILLPPLFIKSGEVKTRQQAYADGDWIGTFNLWIVMRQPEPAMVYQKRSMKKAWAPGLLDIAVGGHYQAGETMFDGLREAKEELGKAYAGDDITKLGQKLYVGFDSKGGHVNNVVDVCMIEDSEPLSSYQLQADEVDAICACPIRELLNAHRDPSYHFSVPAITSGGEATTIEVNKSSFPENWDDYHYKMAILLDRYFKGEQNLLY